MKVILEGEDVSGELRKEDWYGCVKSRCFPRVREALLRRQRSFAIGAGLIAMAEIWGLSYFRTEAKIFLDASAEERANQSSNSCKIKV